ncbi:MAG: hypothetical protein IJU53_04040 [Thermoguttaceae bacterium]|nr:hypothetical protein [Thermoguttaceae bacterium]
MTESQKNIAEQALEKIADKPKKAENLEGSYETHDIDDLIKLDDHLAKKQAAEGNLRSPYGIKSAICIPGRNYG